MLPFQLEDAGKLCLDQASESKEAGAGGEEEKTELVGLDVRLNNRIIDLRVPTNQAIFKIQSGVC